MLESFYRHPREDIASALSRLISSLAFKLDSVVIHRDALDRYRETKVRFVDCVVAATALAENTAVASVDRDFRKFPDVREEIE